MEKILLQDLYDANIEKFSPNITLIRMNKLILDMAYSAITEFNWETMVSDAKELAANFINIIRRSYADLEFLETMHSIETDVEEVFKFFDTKEEAECLKYFALDIGLNSESDQNYTTVTRTIEVFALAKKFGLEFDFSWKL